MIQNRELLFPVESDSNASELVGSRQEHGSRGPRATWQVEFGYLLQTVELQNLRKMNKKSCSPIFFLPNSLKSIRRFIRRVSPNTEVNWWLPIFNLHCMIWCTLQGIHVRYRYTLIYKKHHSTLAWKEEDHWIFNDVHSVYMVTPHSNIIRQHRPPTLSAVKTLKRLKEF